MTPHTYKTPCWGVFEYRPYQHLTDDQIRRAIARHEDRIADDPYSAEVDEFRLQAIGFLQKELDRRV